MNQKLTSSDGDDTYDWVKATVDCDHIDLAYQVTGLNVEGSDQIDDDPSEWSEADIRSVAGRMLGIVPADHELIQVEYS